MLELLVASAFADILQADVSKPPAVCDCPAGHPEFVEFHRRAPKSSRKDGVTLADQLRLLGFTEACPRGYWNDWVWCGAKGALPVCGDVACGPGGKEVARWTGDDAPADPGAVATCKVYQPSLNAAATVWCVPPPAPEPLDLPVIDLPDAPSSPHPGGCATGALPASLAGLLLLALAARKRA